jgi:hypothetical protein
VNPIMERMGDVQGRLLHSFSGKTEQRALSTIMGAAAMGFSEHGRSVHRADIDSYHPFIDPKSRYLDIVTRCRHAPLRHLVRPARGRHAASGVGPRTTDRRRPREGAQCRSRLDLEDHQAWMTWPSRQSTRQLGNRMFQPLPRPSREDAWWSAAVEDAGHSRLRQS